MNYFRSDRNTPISFASSCLIALFFLLFSATSCAGPQPPLFIQSQAYSIGESPPASNLEGWTPYQGILELGYGSKPVWIKLHVAPLADQSPTLPIELDIRPSSLGQIDLYDSLSAATQHKPVGDKFNWSNNARPSFTYNFVVPAGSEPRDILFRIKTSNTRLVDITALSPTEIIPWERTVLTQSNFIIFSLLLFFAWALYNWLIHRDLLIRSFALLQLAAMIYGICILGFIRVYLSDVLTTETQERLTSLSIVAYSFLNIWFYKTLISAYPIKRWAVYLLRVLLGSLLIIIAIYFIGQPWISFMLNAYLILSTYLALLFICIFGITWKDAQENPFLLPKKILIGYFLILVTINLFHLTSVLNLGVSSVTSAYGSTTNGVLNGLLLTIILHMRSRNIAQQHQQRIAAAAMRLENEKQQRALQSEFVDMLAHELKTPLSVIALAIGSESPSEKLKYLAANAVSSMNDVITRCIQATRLTENNLKPNFEHVDPNNVLGQLINNHQESHRMRFHSNYSGLVVADRELLSIAMNNLLDNAIKYGKTHGKVAVELTETHKKQMLQVSIYNDVGQAGVPDPQLVFQKYYRSPGAHHATGSGLGLYLSRMLMQMQHGDISYECVKEQICFRINLPLQSR